MTQRDLPESAVQVPLSATDPAAVHTSVPAALAVHVEVVYMQSASNT